MKPGRFYGTAALCMLLLTAQVVQADSRTALDAEVQGTVERLYEEAVGGEELASEAAGMLVFPRVVKGAFGIGGASGRGALLVNGETVDYYRTTAVSFGFQLGGQVRSQVILFMSQEALEGFRESRGWQAGVDGSITVLEFGAAGQLDTNSVQDEIVAVVFDNKGLMYDLSLSGNKFWKLED